MPSDVKVDSNLINKDEYFKNTIVFIKGNSRILCKTCEMGLAPMYKNSVPEEKCSFRTRWLTHHLQSKNHISFEQDKLGLRRALKLLGKDLSWHSEEEEKDIAERSLDNNQDLEVSENKTEMKSQQSETALKDPDVTSLSKQKDVDFLFDVCKFLITKHMPFNSAPDILEFVQQVCFKYNPEVIKRAHTSSTSITQIIKHCVGNTFKEKVFEDLKQNPFSLLIDCTSGLYGDSYMAILARYSNKFTDGPTVKLIGVIELGGSSTGEALFEKIQEEVFDNDLSFLDNLIAICTDSGSNMFSSKGSGLTNRLQTLNPNIIHIKDLCHAYHNIAEEATQAFPKYIIDFVKDACNFINRSSQRITQFKEYQLQKRKNKLLSSSTSESQEIPSFKDIRWLSLGTCATYIIKNWPDLKEFHQQQESPIKDNFTAEYEIFVSLLSIFLNKLNYYTSYFQNGSYLIDHVLFQMKASFSEFIAYILKEPYDKPEKERNYFEIVYPLSLEDTFHQYLKSLPEFQNSFLSKFGKFIALIKDAAQHDKGIELKFLKIAKEFILIVIKSMKERLLFDNEWINKSMIAYWPKELNINTWSELSKKFSNIIPIHEEFETELDRFRVVYGNIRPFNDPPTSLQILDAWAKQEKDFPLISRLAKSLLTLPYTSAEVERLFSTFKVFKTSYRNRITAQNLEACLLSEQFFEFKDFEILPEMYEKYKTLWVSQKKKVINPKKQVNKVDTETQCELPFNQVEIEKDKGNDSGVYVQALKILADFARIPSDNDEFAYDIDKTQYILRNGLKRLSDRPLRINSEGNKTAKVEEMRSFQLYKDDKPEEDIEN